MDLGEHGLATGLLLLAGLGVGLAGAWWRRSQGRGMIQRWADKNRFKILSIRRCELNRGPYTLDLLHKGCPVFYVEVCAPSGRVSRGWFRCGGRVAGVLKDEIDIHWDEK
jgi:hypothetical protein